jgi:hypothetical protein
MPANPVIHYLHECGLHLRAANGRLIVEPRHLLTDTLRDYIRLHRAEIMATLPAGPAVVHFSLIGGGGGTVIDPGGRFSALQDLLERYGARLDLDALQASFDALAEQEARALILRLQQSTQKKSQGAEQ